MAFLFWTLFVADTALIAYMACALLKDGSGEGGDYSGGAG